MEEEPKEGLPGNTEPKEPEKRDFVVKIGKRQTKYLVVGDCLFACDKDGKPERFVGKIPPKRRGFVF
ncbi:MAG: hypothetical protein V1808_04400 [Candidatus Daviesbacteria bacterium]